MEENLEIYFCEICSESISESEFATKQAIRVKGKVIGGCCLPEFRSTGPDKGAGGVSSIGLTAVGAIVLAGVAGATVFLDARLSKELDRVRGKMHDVRSSVAQQGDMWADLEKRFDSTMQRDGLEPLAGRVEALESKLQDGQEHLGTEIRGMAARFGLVEEEQKRILEGQATVRSEIKDVELEIVRLGREIAKRAAMPRQPVVDRGARGDPKPAGAGKSAPSGAGLPPALAQQITRLKDADVGERFDAVDRLIESRNPAAQPHLLPMLEDADAFVRRLTAEGLAKFKQATTVDALLATLADPESIVRHTAHAALRKLTGQSISFDPDGSISSRNSSRRRWKDWWSKNRAKF